MQRTARKGTPGNCVTLGTGGGRGLWKWLGAHVREGQWSSPEKRTWWRSWRELKQQDSLMNPSRNVSTSLPEDPTAPQRPSLGPGHLIASELPGIHREGPMERAQGANGKSASFPDTLTRSYFGCDYYAHVFSLFPVCIQRCMFGFVGFDSLLKRDVTGCSAFTLPYALWASSNLLNKLEVK